MINVLAIDNAGDLYSSSGYGENIVHVAAPGENVKVILPENDVTYIDGTSVATAFVSATAGLLLSTDNELTPLEIKDRIIKATYHLDTLDNLCVSEGIIDVYKTLQGGQS